MPSVSVNSPKTPVTQGSSGVAAATLPNVCKMPGPPAPFVPTPLPNIGKSDNSPQGYSTTVTIEGNPVAIKGATFNSMGDVASQGTGGGLISSNVQGPTKFIGPGSMDVKIEGKNVQLLGDPMLNNCGPGGSPANAATMGGVIQDAGAESPGGAPTQTGPLLGVTFLVDPCRCGDPVGLRAYDVGLDGQNATFTISQNGNTVTTLNAPLRSGSADATWVSQANTTSMPEPVFTLSGSAGSTTANAQSDLHLQKYDDFAATLKTIACTSGTFAWTGKFDIALTHGEVVITAKVKLLNRQGPKPSAPTTPIPVVGPPVSDADKASMKADIEPKLGARWIFHRKKCARGDPCNCPKDRDCCKMRVRVVVDFVESGEYHTVNLYQGAGRANSGDWTRVKTRENSWAHETGHLLGWYDEYAGGATGPSPRWTIRSGVIMDTGLTVPQDYYVEFRDWLQQVTAEDWTMIAA